MKTPGQKLLDILEMPTGGREQPLASTDIMNQDDLFEMQNKLLELAEEMNGQQAVVKRFPYLYKEVK